MDSVIGEIMAIKFFLYRKTDGVIILFLHERPNLEELKAGTVHSQYGSCSGINYDNVAWYFSETGVDVAEMPETDTYFYNPVNGEARRIDNNALAFTVPAPDSLSNSDVDDMTCVQENKALALVLFETLEHLAASGTLTITQFSSQALDIYQKWLRIKDKM